MSLGIRNAVESDAEAIRDVHLAAFGDGQGPEIVGLVDNLLSDTSARPLLSLVATAGGRVVGHVLFTTATIRPAGQAVSASILAPLAVHPDAQSQGYGARLINKGLSQLAAADTGLVFVLGYPDYYARFGFRPAGAVGLAAPYPIPPEVADAWMVQALRPGIIGTVRGEVVCSDTLNDPGYWQE